MRTVHTLTAAVVLAASLSMPAFAQSTSPNSGTAGTGTSLGTTTQSNDRGFNWGWLGLIGLAGLMGLRKQPESHRTDTTRTAMPR